MVTTAAARVLAGCSTPRRRSSVGEVHRWVRISLLFPAAAALVAFAAAAASGGRAPALVAFAGVAAGSDSYDLFVVDARGGNARNLTPHGGGGSPAWSPDGQRLAFVRTSGLWIMNGDGTRQRILARAHNPGFPTWSPNGRRIAFLFRDGPGYAVALAVVNADGSGLRKLAAADPSVVWPNGRLSWSPDGSWIAFTGGRSMRIVRVDGTRRRIVWHCKSSRTCVDPAWSPDGRELLFSGDDGMMIAGNPTDDHERPRVLTHDGYNQLWTRDGRAVVFEGRDSMIYRMNPDGSGRRLLVNGHNPVLSKDGKSLAFVRGTASAWDLFTCRIDGTGVKRIATNSSVDYPAWGA